jgi:hypothetical protein
MKYSVFSCQSSVLRTLNLETFDQSCEHPLDLDNVFFELSLYGHSHYSKISSETQKILYFARGTHRHMQEPLEIDSASASASFGNVGRNRIRRTANLGSEPETLLDRKRSAGLVDKQSQSVTLLPDHQALEVLHDRSIESEFY